MKTSKFVFFIQLLLLAIIFHISCYALFITQNTHYFISSIFSLAAMVFIVYILHEPQKKQKPVCSKDYYFYFVDRQNLPSEGQPFPFREMWRP